MDQKCPSESIPFFIDTSERLYTQLWGQILGSNTSRKWKEEKLGIDSGAAVVEDLTTASFLASGSMGLEGTSHLTPALDVFPLTLEGGGADL